MKKILNSIYVALAFVFIAIGVIGIVLPVLPTTPFLLLALVLFAKGSERFHKWFMGTLLYKKYVETYMSTKAMPMRTKLKALATVSIFFAIGFVFSPVIWAKVIIVVGWLAHVYFFLFRIKTTDEDIACETKQQKKITGNNEEKAKTVKGKRFWKNFLFTFLSVGFLVYILCGGWSNEGLKSRPEVKAETETEDGNYVIPVSLWHATSNVESGGNAALYQSGKLTVKDGQTTLTLHLKGMSLYGMTGYLMQLNLLDSITLNDKNYPISYELINSTVISTYALTDEYNGPDSTDNVSAGKLYPKTVSIPVTWGTEYTWAQVYVPVMGSLGFGEQLCRIKLDFSGVEQMTQEQQQEWEAYETSDLPDEDDDDDTTTTDKTALKGKLDAANALLTQTDVYTQASLSTLQAAINAAQSAYNNTAATQAVIDAQVTALQTAIEALVKKSTEALDKNNLADGKYNVNINLWHATNDTTSMGNAAINSLALLTVKSGVYTLEFSTRPMTLGTITACLQTFEIEQADGTFTMADIKAKNNSLDGVAMPSVFSFVMPSKEEYLNVKIDPKVEIVGRVLDARLKISWDTLTKVADDSTVKEDTDPVVVTDESPAVDLKDKSTKIRIKADANILEEGVSMTVKEILDGSTYIAIQSLLSDVATEFKAYDITLNSLSGSTVEPKGMVTVYIPVPDSYTASTVAVYRIKDSAKTKLTTTIQDGYAVFQTNSFSTFAIADTSTVTKSTLPAKKATVTTKKSTTSSAVSKKSAVTNGSTTLQGTDNQMEEQTTDQPVIVEGQQNAEPLQMNQMITLVLLGTTIIGSMLIMLFVVGFVLINSSLRRKK